MKKISRFSSVPVAKNRLKNLVECDRITCNAKELGLLKNDLFYTMSKYINLDQQEINIEICPHKILIQIQEKVIEN